MMAEARRRPAAARSTTTQDREAGHVMVKDQQMGIPMDECSLQTAHL